jgi:hypothetical protein
MRFSRGLACGVTVLAISACAAGDDQATPQAAGLTPLVAVAARAPARAPAAARRTRSPVDAARPPRPLPAVAADFARTGEPLIMVAGYRDRRVPLVPVLRPAHAGWRRIGAGEWPAGSGAIIHRSTVATSTVTDRLSRCALGRIEEGDAALTVLVVFR